MIRIVLSVFLVLHGLVHLLYIGQSARLFELQPGMVWPDRSMAISRFLGVSLTRYLAGSLLILAAAGFVAGGAGLFLKQPWWRITIAVTAVFSSVVYILFWDGGLRQLDNQGGIGVLINLVILAALFIFHQPNF